MNLEGLIVGLGNPGRQYEYTRHNFGFRVVDALLSQSTQSLDVRSEVLKKVRDQYDLFRIRFESNRLVWLVAKPMTFMNRSGQAVSSICSYYRIPAERVLVLHDELDLPLGRIKLKFGGGTAGHNGLRSIADSLGTLDFYRLRLGIGKPLTVGMSVTDYVLGRFLEQEQDLVARVVAVTLEGIERLVSHGVLTASEFLHGQKLHLASSPDFI